MSGYEPLDRDGDGGASFEMVRIIKPPLTPAVPPTEEPRAELATPDVTATDSEAAPTESVDAGFPSGDVAVLSDVAELSVPSEAGTEKGLSDLGGPALARPRSVIVIEADEPLDPPAKPRAVIVIDADAPGGLSGDDDASADVDPRIRARRRAVKRAEGRRRFRVLVAIGTLLVLLIGGSLVLQSPLFSVRQVQVDGVHFADKEAIQAVANSLYGQPLYRLDLAKAKEEILLQPWVRRVRIVRTWPRSVTLDVAERTPVGAVPMEDGQWRVIDIEGHVLAVTEGQPRDFMAIEGDPTPVGVGQTVSAPMISGARLAESLPGRLKTITTKVKVGGDGAVALDISPKGRILLGTIDDLRAKLISVLTYLDSCPGVQFETLDARAATALVMTPPNCQKASLTKKAP
jgi:cell division protein FtsQ